MEGIRLNKWLAERGVCSRRAADALIAAGRVTVDGETGQLGSRVGEASAVLLDGKRVGEKGVRIYLALNKPRGVVCTADPREPMNVIDYLNLSERVFPIGRLDKESEGLLLLTNDGDIVNRVLRAVGRHEKEYRVTVDRPVTDDFLRRMAGGVPILGRVTLPCRAWRTGTREFTLVLTQGMNRQIRRMCEYLHYNVERLARVRIMNILLGDMQSGHFRSLTEDEVAGLLARLEGEDTDELAETESGDVD